MEISGNTQINKKEKLNEEEKKNTLNTNKMLAPSVIDRSN